MRVKNMAMTLAKKRTSLDLPPDLLERTDEAVRLGVARSRNSLIAVAIEEYLDARDRLASIDARFAEMQHDTYYRAKHLELAADFAESDAGAFAATFEESGAQTLVLETAGP